MSAPTAPRGSRATSRGRASSRGVPNARDPRINATQRPSKPQTSAPAATRGGYTRGSSKPPAQQHRSHNRSWRSSAPNGAQTKSAILDHAGIGPDHRPSWRNAAREDPATYKARMADLYQTLKDSREKERKKAIQDGFLADPNKPTSLANAITPVGTCQEMCPEFERVERIVQLMVDGNEKISSVANHERKVPAEDLMVKRFRRSAAGYDEQLPSDIRPPTVLKRSLDHLMDSVIGGPEPLKDTHKFVWDRTRGIRNDFSIQQVTKVEDLRVAIDCFERIARFHILSLHQLSHPERDNGEFDHFQEREQLNNTLLSLMYYYDDSRHKMVSANEPEFRAYCIIFEIQDQRPDLEDRAQNWPAAVLKNERVKTALKLYAAAGNTADAQGPLRPRVPFNIAQSDSAGFFALVKSPAVPYLMACVAEIYFNLVRSSVLETIWKAYKGRRSGAAKVEDWTSPDLMEALGFDDEYQTWAFCEEHGFQFDERPDGVQYLQLSSVSSGSIEDTNPRRKQVFSKHLVEFKRYGRILPSVINGLSVSQAQSQGLVYDSDAETASVANSESLFMNGDSDTERPHSSNKSPFGQPYGSNIDKTQQPPASTFGLPSTQNQQTGPTQASSTANSVYVNPFAPKKADNPFAPSNSSKSSPFASNAPMHPSVGNHSNPFNVNPTFKVTPPTEPSPASPFASSNVQAMPAKNAPSIFDKLSSSPAPAIGVGLFQKPSAPPSNNPFQSPQAVKGTDTVSAETKDLDWFKPTQKPAQAAGSTFFKSPFEPPAVATQTNSGPAKNSFVPGTQAAANTSAVFPKDNTTPKSATQNQSVNNSQIPLFQFPQSSQASAAPPNFSQSPMPSENASKQASTSSFDFLRPKTTDSSQAGIKYKSPSMSTESDSQTHGPTTSIPATYQPLNNAFKSFEKPAPAPKPVDPRPEAIEKVADALTLEEDGLIQQYIEMTIAPIVHQAVKEFNDRRSWNKARAVRPLLLARKYARRWKATAWKLSLARRGRERRQRLAESRRRSAAASPQPTNTFPLPNTITSTSHSHPDQANSSSSSHNKRQSLPSDFRPDMSGALTPNGVPKRKRSEDEYADDSDLTQESRRFHSHKRAHTVGDATMSAPPHRTRLRMHQAIDPSTLNKYSLLANTMRKQTRRLAPRASGDNTHTDYFRLKAMGIDPDTPVVPRTKKSGLASNEQPSKSSSHQPTKSTSVNPQSLSQALRNITPRQSQVDTAPNSQPPTAEKPKDDFLDSIRAIRNTLAESTTWFQTERENLERRSSIGSTSSLPYQRSRAPSGAPTASASMSRSASINPPLHIEDETPAQKRLREIRERGRVPSRSELRMRAMGAKAPVPRSFYEERAWEKRRRVEAPEEQRGSDAVVLVDNGKERGDARLSASDCVATQPKIPAVNAVNAANAPSPVRSAAIVIDDDSDEEASVPEPQQQEYRPFIKTFTDEDDHANEGPLAAVDEHFTEGDGYLDEESEEDDLGSDEDEFDSEDEESNFDLEEGPRRRHVVEDSLYPQLPPDEDATGLVNGSSGGDQDGDLPMEDRDGLGEDEDDGQGSLGLGSEDEDEENSEEDESSEDETDDDDDAEEEEEGADLTSASTMRRKSSSWGRYAVLNNHRRRHSNPQAQAGVVNGVSHHGQGDGEEGEGEGGEWLGGEYANGDEEDAAEEEEEEEEGDEEAPSSFDVNGKGGTSVEDAIEL